ncbi:MAG: ion channel [Parvularculaceae bacterium]
MSNGAKRLRAARDRLHELYFGSSAEALRFQTRLLILDLGLIAFFVASPFLERTFWVLALDYTIAALLALDLAARAWAFRDLRRWFMRLPVHADLIVLVSLLFPFWGVNLAFLRVLRLYSLINSQFFWALIARGRWSGTRVEESGKALSNLCIFTFIMTGFVHSTFAARTPTIGSYFDSLYFTVSTLTTTGYGDITLNGVWGRVLSILIMVVGISLFVRLAQVILRPSKIRHECQSCGLSRHEPDAVHCKACGALLHIRHDNE